MLHPNSLFHRYREKIAGLDKIEKDSILNREFALQHDPGLQIYYAPHNEFINPGANIVIVGITPGWSQTQRAYQTAKNGIAQHLTDDVRRTEQFQTNRESMVNTIRNCDFGLR